MDLIEKPTADISPQLVEAVKTFPLCREIEHCGTKFCASPFDFYATCPRCGVRIKLRASSGVPEIEDVFDAVLEWMLQPGAKDIAERRQREIAVDSEA